MDDLQAGGRSGLASAKRRKRNSHRVLGGQGAFKREDAAPDQHGAESPAQQNSQRVIHRVCTVFNAKQIDGIPEYQSKQRTPFEAVQAGERILTNSGARIEHDQFDNAFYNRRTDSIHLPPRASFKDAAGYYGTALHELAHSTGHPSRLNRHTLSDSYRFGDLNYAKEELRAELASVFLAAELGVPRDPANHAAYVGSWIKALREDKNEIFRAAHEASLATDYVLSLDREVSRMEAVELAGADVAGSVAAPKEGIARATQIGTLENNEPGSADGWLADAPDRQTADENRPVARTAVIYDKEPEMDTPRDHLAVASRAAPNTGDLAASFANAKRITADALGESARTLPAQIRSGTYAGRIIGETDCHVVQRLSARTVVAHMKHLLQHLPDSGSDVAIAYSNGRGQVRSLRERVITRTGPPAR